MEMTLGHETQLFSLLCGEMGLEMSTSVSSSESLSSSHSCAVGTLAASMSSGSVAGWRSAAVQGEVMGAGLWYKGERMREREMDQ